MKYHPDLDTN